MRTGRWFASTAIALLCAGCSAGSASPPNAQVHLVAEPFSAPFDTPVRITASGLPSGGLVTLRAQTDDYEGRPWASAAQFRASAAGTLNLATAPPVSGSYRVADAAGLLWSLHPAFTTSPGTQFYINDAGFVVTLQVVVGGRVRAGATLVRRAASGTSSSVQTVARNGFAATLFTPASVKSGTPVVVVIGGSEGGELTLTANGLALVGFPALALAYFGEPGLPPGAEIPVGNVRVPLLLGDGGQDEIWDSAGSASVIVTELRSSGDRAPYINLYYPDAGHGNFGSPPYFPYSDSVNGIVLGGSEQANALAIEQFWTKMIGFIDRV